MTAVRKVDGNPGAVWDEFRWTGTRAEALLAWDEVRKKTPLPGILRPVLAELSSAERSAAEPLS